jgi:hypothetical protein
MLEAREQPGLVDEGLAPEFVAGGVGRRPGRHPALRLSRGQALGQVFLQRHDVAGAVLDDTVDDGEAGLRDHALDFEGGDPCACRQRSHCRSRRGCRSCDARSHQLESY